MASCQFENCNTQPNFNEQGQTKGKYCKTHKLPGMVDVVSRVCQFENCNTGPSFNEQGQTKGKYCYTHKLPGMVDVVSRVCQFENCNIVPNFNEQGQTKGKYCKTHKLPGMVDVVSRVCQFENCNTQPSFNEQGQTKGKYCKTHKLPGMVDVVSRDCQFENCNTQPKFNEQGQTKGKYCKTHKLPGMVDVSNPSCQFENCDTRPSNPKYKGYCCRCFVNLFPNEPNTRNYKIKENHVTDFIKAVFPDENILFDKAVSGGISNRRPDIFIDKETHILVIECDENQHQSTTCENKRMMEIFKDAKNREIVFIRFNPDSYTEDSKKIPSCFKILKQSGIQVIRDEKAWNSRLNKLKETIQSFLTEIPCKEVTIIHLFYDK
jgi:hypothetical protein